jgi:hypothetical protein
LSEKAKNIWEEETLVSWKTFSKNCWYSQYEVFASIYLNFAFIDWVAIFLVEEEVETGNTAYLLRMIQDPASLWSLEIEISALVEGLDAIANFTYSMECDGQLAFKAGRSVDALIA